MLDSLIQRLETISRYAVWAGGAMLFFAAFMVTIDVIIRSTVGRSMGGSDEISGYLLAISTSWALAHALLHRVHVRVDAAYLLLGRAVQAVLDVFGLLVLTAFGLAVTWRAIGVFLYSASYWAKSITPMQTPLAIPQFFWVIGLVLFSITLVVLLLRCIVALVRRDEATIGRLAGARTQSEEVEEEIHMTESRIEPGSGRG
jgi:TRAP-type C4-dicarboxylate transport system permease small subunit